MNCCCCESVLPECTAITISTTPLLSTTMKDIPFLHAILCAEISQLLQAIHWLHQSKFNIWEVLLLTLKKPLKILGQLMCDIRRLSWYQTPVVTSDACRDIRRLPLSDGPVYLALIHALSVSDSAIRDPVLPVTPSYRLPADAASLIRRWNVANRRSCAVSSHVTKRKTVAFISVSRCAMTGRANRAMWRKR